MNESKKFYQVTAKVEFADGEKTKKGNWKFIVDAQNITKAEDMTKAELETWYLLSYLIVEVKESNIKDIITSTDNTDNNQ